MAKYLDDNGLLYLWQKVKLRFAEKTDVSSINDRVTSLENVGAQANVIETVKVNGTALTPDAVKAVDVTVPTNNNQLTNGAGYQTAAQVTAAINDALADITGIDFQVVQELPATGEKGVIYLVPHSHGASDIYDEYIWLSTSSTFEKIGSTDIDLSGYWSKSELVAITNAEIDTILAS